MIRMAAFLQPWIPRARCHVQCDLCDWHFRNEFEQTNTPGHGFSRFKSHIIQYLNLEIRNVSQTILQRQKAGGGGCCNIPVRGAQITMVALHITILGWQYSSSALGLTSPVSQSTPRLTSDTFLCYSRTRGCVAHWMSQCLIQLRATRLILRIIISRLDIWGFLLLLQ